jgi:hypothetical protein
MNRDRESYSVTLARAEFAFKVIQAETSGPRPCGFPTLICLLMGDPHRWTARQADAAINILLRFGKIEFDISPGKDPRRHPKWTVRLVDRSEEAAAEKPEVAS